MCQVYATDVESASLIEAAFQEARRHRWIESQKRGYDRGDQGFLEWYDRYWWIYLRYRHLEHLLGDREWAEFGQRSFGVLAPLVESEDALAVEIIDLYRQGCENLDILNWALRKQLNLPEVRRRLILINMNEARILPKYE